MKRDEYIYEKRPIWKETYMYENRHVPDPRPERSEYMKRDLHIWKETHIYIHI